VTPRIAYVAGITLVGGIGVSAAFASGCALASWFSSGDLVEPFRQHSANFFVFSAFAIRVALGAVGLVGGLAVAGNMAWIVARDAKRR
jgi:hypothetical protein